jgi:cell division protein FtsW
MFALMRTDYRRLREPSVVCTAVCVVLLMLVGTFFLDKSHATHRWIKFGPVGIQPSELAKLAVIQYLAWFLDFKRRSASAMEFCKDDFLQTILPAIGPILIFVMLIVAQPDLGTSVDIVLIATAILFVAGLSWKWLLVGGAAALPALYLLISHVSYRQARLMAFLNPDADPLGAGFQLLQSLIAVGSGGFTGVGLMESKQKLFYLPEAHTDFIYAVICEELGFIGAIRGLRVAWAPRRILRAGRIRSAARAGYNCDGPLSGAHQFCRRAWNGADERDSAPVRELWWFERVGDAAGHRRAPQYQPAGGSVAA